MLVRGVLPERFPREHTDVTVVVAITRKTVRSDLSTQYVHLSDDSRPCSSLK